MDFNVSKIGYYFRCYCYRNNHRYRLVHDLWVSVNRRTCSKFSDKYTCCGVIFINTLFNVIGMYYFVGFALHHYFFNQILGFIQFVLPSYSLKLVGQRYLGLVNYVSYLSDIKSIFGLLVTLRQLFMRFSFSLHSSGIFNT